MYDARTLGKKLQNFRKAAGLQQTDVSATLNITVNRISLCENGRTSFTIKELIGLCELYRITPNDVLGFETDAGVKSIINKIETLSTDKIKLIDNIIDSCIQFSGRENERSLEPEM